MCERVRLPDGTVAIICGGHRRRRKRCSHCPEWAIVECDTCGVPLCRTHRIVVPPDQDYCPRHLAEASAAAARLRAARQAVTT